MNKALAIVLLSLPLLSGCGSAVTETEAGAEGAIEFANAMCPMMGKVLQQPVSGGKVAHLASEGERLRPRQLCGIFTEDQDPPGTGALQGQRI